MKSSLLITIVASVTVILAIIVITLVMTLSDTGPPTDYRQTIINSIKTDNINDTLGFLTHDPHPAGSPVDKQLSRYISVTWDIYGLKVKRMKYEVLLASANAKTPNKVMIVDDTDGTVFESSPTQPPVASPPSGQQNIYSFNSFSGVGTAQSASVVYANYGRDVDFDCLDQHNITVNNSIVLIRYGAIFRGDKVRFAESKGAAAVVLYTDPADAALLGPSNTYPSTVYAPPGATQLGSLKLQGDLLTPGYPAVESAFRLSNSEADLFSIPVQPMGYGDVWHFLSLLEGEEAPDSWQGGLNITYRLGPGLAGAAQVAVVVNDLLELKTVYNVIGFLEGQEEPDRYVIVGNHYDAWTYGGIDPSSATAIVLEVVRVFGEMYSGGWRPRRTLLFCSWAAEENGIIGSTEFAEQFSTVLKDRAVVYLNLDTVMYGNYSFMAAGTPMLHDVLFEMAKLVPNPDPSEVSQGRTSLYDTWLARFPGGPSPRSSDEVASRPYVGPLGSGSDYRPFLFNLGIPSSDLFFMAALDEASLPLYHTAYETHFLTTRLMDRGLLYHQAAARVLGLLTLEFSTQPLLPYNVVTYVEFISTSWEDFYKTHGPQLEDLNVGTDSVGAAVERLVAAGKAFEERRSSLSEDNALALRRYNDAMLLLDKALLAPLGLPGRPLLNHILLAPSLTNGYVWDTFPGLQDILRAAQSDGTADTTTNTTTSLLTQHVAALTHHLTMATQALTLSPW